MKKYTLNLLLCGITITSHAQSITPSTFNVCGNFVNTGYYQFEWSVGEATIIESFIQPSITLLNGVLQPYTDKTIPSLTDDQWTANEIKIFPSPTKGLFEVNVMTKQQGVLEMQLLDNSGNVLKTYAEYYYGIGRIVRFDITRNSSANYFLRINLSPNAGFSKKRGSFKILKIN